MTWNSVDRMSLANHKAKKSNNPQNNSGLSQYVISVHKTSAVHIKIMISVTDNYIVLSQVSQNTLLIFDYH